MSRPMRIGITPQTKQIDTSNFWNLESRINFKIQPTFTCSKSTMETTDNDILQVSLLLTLKRIDNFFWCCDYCL